MYVYHNIETDSVLHNNYIYARNQLIEQLTSRFSTYGYREISTSMFEKYNLYAKMNGTVNHREMIKTIDNTGQVLVLRPDITIPLTKELANSDRSIQEDLRYYYTLDVYRQVTKTHEYRQHTQAGVEFFGNRSLEADAEIISLAAHSLRELKLGKFTIELGHANFFKQLIKTAELNEEAFRELKGLVQSKNIPELALLVDALSLEKDTEEIILALPHLYGKLDDVVSKAKSLPLSDDLCAIVQDIEAICRILDYYQVSEHIVVDLSLINHMDYYSDIIFQGFIESIGTAVLMGGRYDHLAKHFKADFPAIGFAFDIDLLLAGIPYRDQLTVPEIHFLIEYEKTMEKEAIFLAQALREHSFDVVSYIGDAKHTRPPMTLAKLSINAQGLEYKDEQQAKLFSTIDEALQWILQTWEEK